MSTKEMSEKARQSIISDAVGGIAAAVAHLDGIHWTLYKMDDTELYEALVTLQEIVHRLQKDVLPKIRYAARERHQIQYYPPREIPK